ncbi:hypothetical protein JOF36_000019 [Pseudonocardia parietis]|uniref:Uncharacterized protein n=1 Tax=Pseudonocardia parietis TaxID=570936 RepID=A0ABS4VK76_9PSEU|nr:hypothetical protein [Pseudonocardia parietis]
MTAHDPALFEERPEMPEPQTNRAALVMAPAVIVRRA